jgi:hypothetical protein
MGEATSELALVFTLILIPELHVFSARFILHLLGEDTVFMHAFAELFSTLGLSPTEIEWL